MAHLDRVATALAAAPDETRTKAQLRADAAGDALAGVLGAAGSTGVTVMVTVPVMTLLGVGEEPGILAGHGPIAPDVARRLAAHAPSFFRLLTTNGLLPTAHCLLRTAHVPLPAFNSQLSTAYCLLSTAYC